MNRGFFTKYTSYMQYDQYETPNSWQKNNHYNHNYRHCNSSWPNDHQRIVTYDEGLVQRNSQMSVDQPDAEFYDRRENYRFDEDVTVGWGNGSTSQGYTSQRFPTCNQSRRYLLNRARKARQKIYRKSRFALQNKMASMTIPSQSQVGSQSSHGDEDLRHYLERRRIDCKTRESPHHDSIPLLDQVTSTSSYITYVTYPEKSQDKIPEEICLNFNVQNGSAKHDATVEDYKARQPSEKMREPRVKQADQPSEKKGEPRVNQARQPSEKQREPRVTQARQPFEKMREPRVTQARQPSEKLREPRVTQADKLIKKHHEPQVKQAGQPSKKLKESGVKQADQPSDPRLVQRYKRSVKNHELRMIQPYKRSDENYKLQVKQAGQHPSSAKDADPLCLRRREILDKLALQSCYQQEPHADQHMSVKHHYEEDAEVTILKEISKTKDMIAERKRKCPAGPREIEIIKELPSEVEITREISHKKSRKTSTEEAQLLKEEREVSKSSVRQKINVVTADMKEIDRKITARLSLQRKESREERVNTPKDKTEQLEKRKENDVELNKINRQSTSRTLKKTRESEQMSRETTVSRERKRKQSTSSRDEATVDEERKRKKYSSSKERREQSASSRVKERESNLQKSEPSGEKKRDKCVSRERQRENSPDFSERNREKSTREDERKVNISRERNRDLPPERNMSKSSQGRDSREHISQERNIETSDENGRNKHTSQDRQTDIPVGESKWKNISAKISREINKDKKERDNHISQKRQNPADISHNRNLSEDRKKNKKETTDLGHQKKGMSTDFPKGVQSFVTVVSSSHTCPVCRQRFISHLALERHENTHFDLPPYLCNTCHLVHIKHPCVVCKKQYSNKSSLKEHMMLYHEMKSYTCEVCRLKFSTELLLRDHELFCQYIVVLPQNPDKPYGCGECRKPFSGMNSMRKHIRNVHLRHSAI